MKRSFIILIALSIELVSLNVFSADIDAGKNRAATCSACHGYKGITANTEWPNLAGQKVAYLVQQLKAFRDGARQDPVMAQMATGLTDEDIQNLAAYYNSLAIN